MYQLTVVPKRTAALSLTQGAMSHEALARELSTFVVGEKDGEALIPATFRPCPAKCRNHGKPKAVDCGGGKLHRLGANVEAMTMFGADLDHLDESALEDLLERLKAAGIAFFWWNTYSHSPPNDARARILIPFDKPFPLKSAAQWSKGAWPLLVKHLGLDEATAQADSSCKDPARVYYAPRKPDAEATRSGGYVPGKALDWEAVIGNKLDGFAAAAEIEVRAPLADPSKPVDLEELKGNLGRTALMERLKKGQALTSAPEARKPGDRSRYEAWRSATWAVAMAAPDEAAEDALLEVLRPSWYAEVEECPGDHTEWETIVDLFEKAHAQAPQKRAEERAARAAEQAAFLEMVEAQCGPKPSFREPPRDGGGAAEDEEDWKDALQWTQNKRGERLNIKKGVTNLKLILERSPMWKGALRFNLLSHHFEIWGGPLFNGQVREFTDEDTTAVQQWLDEVLDLTYQPATIWDYVRLVAKSNSYDPIVSYLREHITWDGTARVERMLEEIFIASLSTEDGADRTAYVRAISKKWMIAAVARALKPGAKVDTMLVFYGGQGVKKTTALETLGGAWYANFRFDLRSNDACTAASENWICEMGELANLKNAEREYVKSFLSTSQDRYRPPYGRVQITRQRRCIFAGTTNDPEIFNDPTGGRRFWPVSCGDIDLERLKRERDQLWAEAVALFDAGEEWWLTPEEEAFAKTEVAAREVQDSVGEQIEDWYTRKAPEKRPAQIRVSDLARDALHMDRAPDLKDQRRIVAVLTRLGFTRWRTMRDGRTAVFYRPPAALMNARVRAVDESDNPIQLVGAATRPKAEA